MGEMVCYPSDGGTSTGYLALPPGGAGPGVLVIQEWWSLAGHVTSLVDRFAQVGFVALAPDLYHGLTVTEPDEAGKLLMGLAMDRAAQDIAGAADYLAARPDSGDQVAAVGFRMGGSLALWSATRCGRITTTVGFYPVVPWERMDQQWDNYAGKAAVIHCSGEDSTSAAPGVQTVRRAIEQAGGECTRYDYPGTRPAFFNDDRPEVYDPDAAARAWARTLDLLRTRLG